MENTNLTNETSQISGIWISNFISSNPMFALCVFILALIFLVVIFVLLFKKLDKLKFKDFEIYLKNDKESTKTDTVDSKVTEIKEKQEERLRNVINKQITLVDHYLQNFKPLLVQLITEILNDAVLDSLGITRCERVGDIKIESIQGSDDYYTLETTKTFHHVTTTRTFVNMIESDGDSLLKELELEIIRMLVNNNIGKNKEEVKEYIKRQYPNIVGIIRNYLSNIYTNLSGKSQFDFHKYFLPIGIHYPEDYVQDKMLELFTQCMNIRYYDFN